METAAMTPSAGLHHITAICSEPRKNVAFYTRDLGLRMVKKTVNFDDPGTWHLYFGDETGSPGTVLTFFAWPLPRGRNGIGMAVETAFAIPESARSYWLKRFKDRGVRHDAPEQRFGETVLPLNDPDGGRLELIATPAVESLPGWSNGDVPAEHAIRGFYGVSLWVGATDPTAKVLTNAFGFRPRGREGNRHRFVATGGPIGGVVDIRTAPNFPAGQQGAGSIHHVAFRAADDRAQTDMVGSLRALGLKTTDQIDRQYFRSIYFREPGGVLFEIATDEPGFTVDEPKEKLGHTIKLPAWYEPKRAEIEAALPPLD
jgi:glyoxalase family protein